MSSSKHCGVKNYNLHISSSPTLFIHIIYTIVLARSGVTLYIAMLSVTSLSMLHRRFAYGSTDDNYVLSLNNRWCNMFYNHEDLFEELVFYISLSHAEARVTLKNEFCFCSRIFLQPLLFQPICSMMVYV